MTEVVIIGAGAAGLAAAVELSQAKINVTVLEARDRAGGRIHTHHAEHLSVPIELGAEFIHGRHPSLMKLLDSIPFSDVTERHWYFENGEARRSNEFWNKLTALMDLMSLDKPDQSLRDFLASASDDPASRKAKEMAIEYVQGFHAAQIDRIGVHGLVKANDAEAEIQGEKSYRVIEGYDRVINALLEQARAKGVSLQLATVVKEIGWNSRSVEINCLVNGTTQKFSAGRCLITLPLGVLQARANQDGAVRFFPELPIEKQIAINALVMGHARHITLRFRQRFWEALGLPGISEDLSQLGFIHYPDAALPTWWTLLHIHAPVLVGWTGGPNAEQLIGASEEVMLDKALDSLQLIFGLSESHLRELILSVHTHDWSSDPYTRGAYTYLPVNGLAAQKALAAPVDDVLFFAGEATSVGQVGTVHGAIESGQRAAKEILESL